MVDSIVNGTTTCLYSSSAFSNNSQTFFWSHGMPLQGSVPTTIGHSRLVQVDMLHDLSIAMGTVEAIYYLTV